jgi:hypothetical protein
VQLIDMNGIVQKEFTLTKSEAGIATYNLAVAGLVPGTYLMRMQIGAWIENKKFMKH